jgi:hypothetical protein
VFVAQRDFDGKGLVSAGTETGSANYFVIQSISISCGFLANEKNFR